MSQFLGIIFTVLFISLRASLSLTRSLPLQLLCTNTSCSDTSRCASLQLRSCIPLLVNLNAQTLTPLFLSHHLSISIPYLLLPCHLLLPSLFLLPKMDGLVLFFVAIFCFNQSIFRKTYLLYYLSQIFSCAFN